MIGPTGSGKTFLSRIIAKAGGGLVVTADDIRIALRKENQSYEKVVPITENITKYYLNHYKKVILDSDFSDWKKRALIRSFASRSGAKLIFVQVICDYDVIAGRVLADQYSETKNQFFHGASCLWQGDDHGKVVKLRELWRNTPNHFAWSKSNQMGGSWKPKKISCASITIDTTEGVKVETIKKLF